MNGDKSSLKMFGAKLAETNFYNQSLKIVRVEFNGNFFDFKYLGGYEVPNSKKHIAIIVTEEESIDDIGLSTTRLNFPPGILNSEGELADLTLGFVFLMPLNKSSSTTNANSGGSTFTINKIGMTDLEKLTVSISPPTNKDYTSNDTVSDDLNDQNIGIFINDKGAILIKSSGGSIALGDEGVYIGGSVAWESSEHQREWMMDNFIQRFVPSTIPTAAAAIPELPNLAKFAQIAEAGRKIRNITSIFNSARNLIS